MSTTVSASAARAFLGILAMSNGALKPVKVSPDKERSQHNGEDNHCHPTNHLVALGLLGSMPSRTRSQGRVSRGATLTLTVVLGSCRESRSNRVVSVVMVVVIVTVVSCSSGGIGDLGSLVDHTVVLILVDVFRGGDARVVVNG